MRSCRGEGCVGVGAQWFAEDSKGLGGVSNCKEKGETKPALAWNGTILCAQAVLGLSWRIELPSEVDLCGSHADALSSKLAVLGSQWSTNDFLTDCWWDGIPHNSLKMGLQGLSKTGDAIWQTYGMMWCTKPHCACYSWIKENFVKNGCHDKEIPKEHEKDSIRGRR